MLVELLAVEQEPRPVPDIGAPAEDAQVMDADQDLRTRLGVGALGVHSRRLAMSGFLIVMC